MLKKWFPFEWRMKFRRASFTWKFSQILVPSSSKTNCLICEQLSPHAVCPRGCVRRTDATLMFVGQDPETRQIHGGGGICQTGHCSSAHTTWTTSPNNANFTRLKLQIFPRGTCKSYNQNFGMNCKVQMEQEGRFQIAFRRRAREHRGGGGWSVTPSFQSKHVSVGFWMKEFIWQSKVRFYPGNTKYNFQWNRWKIDSTVSCWSWGLNSSEENVHHHTEAMFEGPDRSHGTFWLVGTLPSNMVLCRCSALYPWVYPWVLGSHHIFPQNLFMMQPCPHTGTNKQTSCRESSTLWVCLFPAFATRHHSQQQPQAVSRPALYALPTFGCAHRWSCTTASSRVGRKVW